jgi:hypothetical protein
MKITIGDYDVTQLVRTVTWSGDYKQCARTLTLGLLSSPTDRNIPVVPCEVGMPVVLAIGARVLFEGYIFSRQKSTAGSVIDITCFDRGIYLKRSEAVYKFVNMTPEAIVGEICRDFNIPMGNIASTGVKISRNFISVSLYRIMQTAYTLAAETTGEKYQMRFEGKNLSVIKKGVSDETLIIQGGSNLMSATTSESIENMVNQVNIYNSADELIGSYSDPGMIAMYGLFQSYIKQPDDKDATAKAKKMLTDNSITQKLTVECLGNLANVTGNAVVVREPYTGLYGLFYIDSDTHTWKNGQYYNKLVVNFNKIMDEQEAGNLPNADGSKTGGTWEYINKPGTGA